MTTVEAIAAELRAWAKGSYADEAAVELVTRAFGGRFAHPAAAWIVKDKCGRRWLDGEQITAENIGVYSGGEQRLLRIIAAMSGGTPFDLTDVAGLDRGLVDLVLAAIAHAAGSHEHAMIQRHSDGTGSFTRPGSLHPWPTLTGDHE